MLTVRQANMEWSFNVRTSPANDDYTIIRQFFRYKEGASWNYAGMVEMNHDAALSFLARFPDANFLHPVDPGKLG